MRNPWGSRLAPLQPNRRHLGEVLLPRNAVHDPLVGMRRRRLDESREQSARTARYSGSPDDNDAMKALHRVSRRLRAKPPALRRCYSNMEQFIGCDALRAAHDRQLYREFLGRLPAHSAIAVEASGSYSWLVDEMERCGHHPRLGNPHEAKRRMGLTNKTDKLDAKASCAISASCCACGSFW
jgi:hypothetical protein